MGVPQNVEGCGVSLSSAEVPSDKHVGIPLIGVMINRPHRCKPMKPSAVGTSTILTSASVASRHRRVLSLFQFQEICELISGLR